jgi:hypothetical protein
MSNVKFQSTTIASPPKDTNVATETIDGAELQRMKLAIGDAGIDDGNISETNPMPIKDSDLSLQIYINGNDMYICKAVPGSTLNSPVWRIKKYNTVSDISGRYANGVATFNNLATDLVTVQALSYS